MFVLTYSETILFPVGIYLFKVNNKITRKRREKCPRLTKKAPERRSGVFLFNFGHILLLALLFLMLTLN